MSSQDITLGYWNTRGRAQPIRFLLAYLELPYHDKTYNRNEDQKHAWFKQDKFNIGLELPNLPYIFVGDYKLSQSIAIMHYLPIKFNRSDLIGKTVEDQGKVQQIMNFIQDFRVPVRNLSFSKNYKEGLQKTYEPASKFITQLETILQRQEWLVGDYLTICDFFLYEYFHIFRGLYPEESQKFKAILKFQEKFEQIPQIQKYLQTESYRKHIQLFPNAASFTGIEYVAKLNQSFGRSKL